MRDYEAQQVARAAVKEMFFMLGVDVEDAAEVEAFRRDIRFAGDLRRQMAKGVGAVMLTLVGAATAYIWALVASKK